LVSDDHKKVAAHKLVLSACSEYLRDIFKNNPHSHPLICLDGVSSEDIKNIMDYIYNGEVQIFQESLDSFLDLAERRKLEGIVEGIDNPEENISLNILSHTIDNKRGYKEKIVPNAEKIVRPEVEVKEDKTEHQFQDVLVPVHSEDLNEIRNKVNEYLEECSNGSIKCRLCCKTSSQNKRKSNQRQSMKRHI